MASAADTARAHVNRRVHEEATTAASLVGIPSDARLCDVDPSALVASGGEADVAEHMENMHEEEAECESSP